jgi:hypothetical protein
MKDAREKRARKPLPRQDEIAIHATCQMSASVECRIPMERTQEERKRNEEDQK